MTTGPATWPGPHLYPEGGPVAVTGVDLSHHQGEPDWPLLARSCGFVVLKATEGTTYTDPTFAARRAAAQRVGLAVGMYHFARLGDPAAEAAAVVRCIGGVRPGEFLALDLEVTAAGVNPVAWTGQWIDALAKAGVPVRLLYINRSELTALNWAPIVARGVGLWLAAYDHTPAPVPSGAWPALAMKQYTDAGTTPGIPGTEDVDVLYGALTDLTGALVTAVDLTQAAIDAIWHSPGDANFGPTYIADRIIATNKDADETVVLARQLAAAVPQLAQALAAVSAKVDALAAKVDAIPAAQAMTCQGSPQAVLTAIGVKLAAPTPASA